MTKKLPFLGKLFAGETKTQEPLLTLEISDDKKIKAALWQVKKGKSEILKKRIQEFKGEWKEIILQLRELVTDLVNESGLDKEPRQVIFGLPQDFIKEDKIKPPYQSSLKKICEQLSLTPLGFVETAQAIAFFLKEKEGHPLTAILLRMAKESFSF